MTLSARPPRARPYHCGACGAEGHPSRTCLTLDRVARPLARWRLTTMALSNAARRRLAALRATGVPVHTDAELARMARASSPTPAAPPAKRRARRVSPAGKPCGMPGCANGCHDCE